MTRRWQVLLVGEAGRFRSALALLLEEEGLPVIVASTTCDGLHHLRRSVARAVITDWDLADGGAASVCQAARCKVRGAHVLALGSDGHPAHRREALSAGADDFLVKQFVDPREVAARVAVSSWARTDLGSEVVHDPVMRCLSHGQCTVELTPTESALYARLAGAGTDAVAWVDLAKSLRTSGKSGDRQEVAVYMALLRRKVEPLGLRVKNRRGAGYLLARVPQADAFTENADQPPSER